MKVIKTFLIGRGAFLYNCNKEAVFYLVKKLMHEKNETYEFINELEETVFALHSQTKKKPFPTS